MKKINYFKGGIKFIRTDIRSVPVVSLNEKISIKTNISIDYYCFCYKEMNGRGRGAAQLRRAIKTPAEEDITRLLQAEKIKHFTKQKAKVIGNIPAR